VKGGRPVTIATVTTGYVGRLIFGSHPAFVIPKFQTPDFHTTNPFVLLLFLGQEPEDPRRVQCKPWRPPNVHSRYSLSRT